MPTAIKDMEETLNIVHSLIQTNLQTYLNVINAEKNDGITLTAPIAANYIDTEIDAIAGFPFIQFVPNTDDNVISGGTWDERDFNIIIKVHNVSTQGKISECAKRGYRFERAIKEIILDNRTISDQVIGIKINNVNYNPMMTDGHGFKQEIWLNATVKHHNTFS